MTISNQKTATTFTFNEPDGGKLYLVDGQMHREDGPAIDRANEKEWYVKGLLHRENGPARMFKKNLYCEWFLEGKHITSASIIQSVFDEHWNNK